MADNKPVQGMAFRFDIGDLGDLNIFADVLPLHGRGYELHDAPGNKLLHDQDAEALGLLARTMVPWSNTIIAPKILLTSDTGDKREVRDAVVFWTERNALAPNGRKERCSILISSFLNEVEARAAIHRCIFEAIEYRMSQKGSAETILNLSTLIKAHRSPVVSVMERLRKTGEVERRRNAFAVAGELRLLTGMKLFAESENPVEAFFATILDGSLGAQLDGNVEKDGLPKVEVSPEMKLIEARSHSSGYGSMSGKNATLSKHEFKDPQTHQDAVDNARLFWGGKRT